MVDDLFELSRIQSGALSPVRRTVDAATTSSDDVVAGLAPMAEAGGVRLGAVRTARRGGRCRCGQTPTSSGRVLAQPRRQRDPAHARRTARSRSALAPNGVGMRARASPTAAAASGEEDLPRVFDAGWRGAAARTPGLTAARASGWPSPAASSRPTPARIDVVNTRRRVPLRDPPPAAHPAERPGSPIACRGPSSAVPAARIAGPSNGTHAATSRARRGSGPWRRLRAGRRPAGTLPSRPGAGPPAASASARARSRTSAARRCRRCNGAASADVAGQRRSHVGRGDVVDVDEVAALAAVLEDPRRLARARGRSGRSRRRRRTGCRAASLGRTRCGSAAP